MRSRRPTAIPANLMRRYWEAHDLILKAMSTTDGPVQLGGRVLPLPQRQYLAAPVSAADAAGVDDGPQPRDRPDGGRTWPCRRNAAVAVGRRADVRRLSQAGAGARLDRRTRPLRLCRRASGSDQRARRGCAAPTSPPIMCARRVVVAEPFTNPPGYNSVAANVAMLKSGGKRGGFVRDRKGNAGRPHAQRRSSSSSRRRHRFAGTPDDVYNQIKALQ